MYKESQMMMMMMILLGRDILLFQAFFVGYDVFVRLVEL